VAPVALNLRRSAIAPAGSAQAVRAAVGVWARVDARSRYPGRVLTRIDHVQLAMPAGGEPDARRFFVEVLGMTEVPKPPALAVRGGCWFRAGQVELHLGVEADFRPAKKAHPALRVADLDALLARLAAAGVEVRPATDLPGVRRCHVDDCFGNRIELIADAG